MTGVCLNSSTGLRSDSQLVVALTGQEFIWVHGFNGTWDVEVDPVHGSRALHCFFVGNVVVRDRHAELQHSELNITCSSNVTVHVYFVVKRLLVLYHETFIRRVFVTL